MSFIAIFSNFVCRYFLSENLKNSYFWFENISFKDFLLRMVPPGILTGADITLSTAAFEYSSITLVEIIKSGVPMLVLIFSIVTLLESASASKFAVISLLCAGILFSSLGEVDLSVGGVSLGILATFCGASRLVLIQKLLSPSEHSSEHEKIHPLLSLSYFSPVILVSLLLPWTFLEAERLFASHFFSSFREGLGTLLFLSVGVLLALLLNIDELFIIKVTSALTLCVAGIAKLLLLTAFSAIYFSYQFDAYNIIGIILASFGIAGYNLVRLSESKSKELEFRTIEDSSFPYSDASDSETKESFIEVLELK